LNAALVYRGRETRLTRFHVPLAFIVMHGVTSIYVENKTFRA